MLLDIVKKKWSFYLIHWKCTMITDGCRQEKGTPFVCVCVMHISNDEQNVLENTKYDVRYIWLHLLERLKGIFFYFANKRPALFENVSISSKLKPENNVSTKLIGRNWTHWQRKCHQNEPNETNPIETERHRQFFFNVSLVFFLSPFFSKESIQLHSICLAFFYRLFHSVHYSKTFSSRFATKHLDLKHNRIEVWNVTNDD